MLSMSSKPLTDIVVKVCKDKDEKDEKELIIEKDLVVSINMGAEGTELNIKAPKSKIDKFMQFFAENENKMLRLSVKTSQEDILEYYSGSTYLLIEGLGVLEGDPANLILYLNYL